MARFVFAQKVLQTFEVESEEPRGDVIRAVRNGDFGLMDVKAINLETEGLPYFIGVKNG